MQDTILILTQPDDLHATAVAQTIIAKGGTVDLWFTSDFPHRAVESIAFRGPEAEVRIAAVDFTLEGKKYKTVWHRRPAYSVDGDLVHASDVEFVEQQCRSFRHGLFAILEHEAFWVNPRATSVQANNKILQHLAARKAGLEMPATLYSNDPAAVRSFLRDCSGEIVYKPLQGMAWGDDTRQFVPFTTVLTEDLPVADEVLQCTPGIFQEIVPKNFEVRITMMGKRAYGVKLYSQSTDGGKLDWRKAWDDLPAEPLTIPGKIRTQCWSLLKRLGLVFGCFDFIVTPEGRWVFLEVNQMGQFLFLETKTGMPVLNAFSEFLMQGKVDFNPQDRGPTVHYRDIDEAAMDLVSATRSIHPQPKGFYMEKSAYREAETS